MPSEIAEGTVADDKARWARFVCSSTGMTEFPIQRVGSGFTFLVENTVCLITAKHGIDNNQADPKGIILPPLDDSLTWWSSDACVHLEATEPYRDDPTFADLALYSMYTPPKLREHLNDFDLLTIPKDLEISVGAPLVAFGYPRADIDVEEPRFIIERLEIEGNYLGPTSHRGLHSFESKHLAAIDPNGMSGGPLTYRLPDGRHILAGVIVQGSSEAQKLHFISTPWLIDALHYALPLLFKIRSEFHGGKVDVEDNIGPSIDSQQEEIERP